MLFSDLRIKPGFVFLALLMGAIVDAAPVKRLASSDLADVTFGKKNGLANVDVKSEPKSPHLDADVDLCSAKDLLLGLVNADCGNKGVKSSNTSGDRQPVNVAAINVGPVVEKHQGQSGPRGDDGQDGRQPTNGYKTGNEHGSASGTKSGSRHHGKKAKKQPSPSSSKGRPDGHSSGTNSRGPRQKPSQHHHDDPHGSRHRQHNPQSHQTKDGDRNRNGGSHAQHGANKPLVNGALNPELIQLTPEQLAELSHYEKQGAHNGGTSSGGGATGGNAGPATGGTVDCSSHGGLFGVNTLNINSCNGGDGGNSLGGGALGGKGGLTGLLRRSLHDEEADADRIDESNENASVSPKDDDAYADGKSVHRDENDVALHSEQQQQRRQYGASASMNQRSTSVAGKIDDSKHENDMPAFRRSDRHHSMRGSEAEDVEEVEENGAGMSPSTKETAEPRTAREDVGQPSKPDTNGAEGFEHDHEMLRRNTNGVDGHRRRPTHRNEPNHKGSGRGRPNGKPTMKKPHGTKHSKQTSSPYKADAAKASSNAKTDEAKASKAVHKQDSAATRKEKADQKQIRPNKMIDSDENEANRDARHDEASFKKDGAATRKEKAAAKKDESTAQMTSKDDVKSAEHDSSAGTAKHDGSAVKTASKNDSNTAENTASEETTGKDGSAAKKEEAAAKHDESTAKETSMEEKDFAKSDASQDARMESERPTLLPLFSKEGSFRYRGSPSS